LSEVEARLVEFKNQEIKLCEKIRGLEFNVESKNNKIKRLINELKELKKEKEGLDSKLTGFESAAKDVDTLLGSQRFDKNNEGLGPSPSIESNLNDLQNSDCAEVKTNKVETARKSSIRYAEIYRNTSKSPKRVKRLERELKARTPPTKIQKVYVRGRSRSVMAWVPKMVRFSYVKGNSGTKLEYSLRTKRSRGSRSISREQKEAAKRLEAKFDEEQNLATESSEITRNQYCFD
nr:hypothetical protein [Tanacetum cinerariifolium]